MSDPPSAAAQTNRPEPHQARPATGADAPSRTGRLLGLVRTLIDYGRQLAATLQQRTSATNLADITTRNFGTIDIGKSSRASPAACFAPPRSKPDCPAASPASRLHQPPRAPHPHRQPRAARPVDPTAHAADQGLARLPAPEDIAAEVRRRPVGSVIADICRDLGIVPSNPLWRELSLAIIDNGGNLATLFKDTWKRLSIWLTDPPAAMHPAGPAPSLSFAVTPGTGPP